jgi:hypothetical protein
MLTSVCGTGLRSTRRTPLRDEYAVVSGSGPAAHLDRIRIGEVEVIRIVEWAG